MDRDENGEPVWTEPKTNEEWITQAIERIQVEVECVMDHWRVVLDRPAVHDVTDDTTAELGHALEMMLLHCSSLTTGLSVLAQTVVQMAGPEVAASVARTLLEQKYGVALGPLERVFENEHGTMFAVAIDHEQVPETIGDVLDLFKERGE